MRRLANAVLVSLLLWGSQSFGASCDSLRGLKLPGTTITSAVEVAAGSFTPPAGDLSGGTDIQVLASLFKQLPAFCRVKGQSKPTPDSDIRFQVWLPVTDWNKRLMSNGNGGFAGSISTIALARALAAGFASVSTDT